MNYVTQGCYVLHDPETNKVYVGQSEDIDRRLAEHARNPKLAKCMNNVTRLEVPPSLGDSGVKVSREYFEQHLLNYYIDKGYEVENLRNPIGKKRQVGFLEAAWKWLVKAVT